MKVAVHSQRSNRSYWHPGKTQDANGPIQVRIDNSWYRPELVITVDSQTHYGTGERGGDIVEIDHKGTAVLQPEEFLKIVQVTIAEKFIDLSSILALKDLDRFLKGALTISRRLRGEE